MINRMLLGLLLIFPLVAAEETAKDEAIVLNLSGRQRMLSQRMTKEILLVSLDVNKASNLSRLKNTAQLFDRTLIGLLNGDKVLELIPTTNDDIRIQLALVFEIWDGYKNIIDKIVKTGEVTDAQLKKALEINLPLLKEMNKAVYMYEENSQNKALEANPGLATQINLSGKQRMLTQKLTKEFLTIVKGWDVEKTRVSFKATMSLFDKTLIGLSKGDAELNLPACTNRVLRRQLKKTKEIWDKLKPLYSEAMSQSGADVSSSSVNTIESDNIKLLKAMNRCVTIFEKMAK